MTWASSLEDFAAHLERQRSALGESDISPLEAFEFPPDLGPLPKDLEPRAKELLNESIELQFAVETLRDELARQLVGLVKRPRFTEDTKSSISFEA